MLRGLCFTAFSIANIGVAGAGVSTTLSEVPISANAIAADGFLQNCRTFDLRVVVTPGVFDWFAAAGLDVQLSQGEMYSPEFEGSFPQPAALLNLYPNIEFDTYVSAPDYNPSVASIGVVGRYTATGGGEPPQFPSFNGPRNRLNAVWGRLPAAHVEGTFTITRITLAPNSFGSLIGEIRSTDPRFGQYFVADVTAGAITSFRIVPEPSSAGFLLSGLAALTCRRRSAKSTRPR